MNRLYLGFHPSSGSPAAPPRVNLQRQLETEPVLIFLDQAAMVLQAANITNAERTTQLLNASQPTLAEAIIQTCPNVVPQPTFRRQYKSYGSSMQITCQNSKLRR
jgi:hypothetical protein